MEVTFTVVIGTYGDREWFERGATAFRSATDQTVEAQVIRLHGDTLAMARNNGAASARGDYLVFLDADDTLDPRYIESMACAVYRAMIRSDHKTFLFQPSTLGVYADGSEDSHPVLIPQRALNTGNFMVIGTAVEREQFLRVGGFHEYPMYEDWDLWIRFRKDGAGFVKVPDAVYRVGVSPHGRNLAPRDEQVRWFNEIRRKHFR